MVDLLLNLISSGMVSILMRVSEGKVSGRVSMLAANYLTCSGLALVFSLAGGVPPAEGLGRTVGLGLLGGLLYLLAFLLLQFNVGENGVVLSAAFMKLGLLVPVGLSVLLFGERPRPTQLLGFAVALGAILLITLKGERRESRTSGGTLWLVALLLCAGGANAMSKLFEQWGRPGWSEWFLTCIFGSALLMALAVAARRGERPGGRELFYGVLIGVPNYFASRFLLRALEQLPAVLVYPISNLGALALATLAGVTLFRERLDGRSWLGLGGIAAAVALLNL